MMKNRIINILSVLVLVALLVLFSNDAEAQCAMCKAGVESNHANGGTSAQGLNNGILYMLATPYLLIAGLAFIWWKGRKAKMEVGEEV